MRSLELMLVVGGLGLQVIGVFAMANGYTTVGDVPDPGSGSGAPAGEGESRRESGVLSLLALLASALVRGKLAKGTVRIQHLAPENRLRSLQGLALIGLGFALQLTATVLELVRTAWPVSGG